MSDRSSSFTVRGASCAPFYTVSFFIGLGLAPSPSPAQDTGQPSMVPTAVSRFQVFPPTRAVRPRAPRHDSLLLLAAVEAARSAKKMQEEVTTLARSIDYSGPRFGVTYLPKAAVDSLKQHNINVGNTISQFGWQFEREIHVSPDGPRVLNEWVFLAGGLESGVFLPSVTWLIGARDRSGNEIGVGPNASVAGVGMAAAAGVTVHDGGVNFPMNVAVAKSKTGARVSFLTGFTIH